MHAEKELSAKRAGGSQSATSERQAQFSIHEKKNYPQARGFLTFKDSVPIFFSQRGFPNIARVHTPRPPLF